MCADMQERCQKEGGFGVESVLRAGSRSACTACERATFQANREKAVQIRNARKKASAEVG